MVEKTIKEIKEQLSGIYRRKALLRPQEYVIKLKAVNRCLESETPHIRPADSQGLPGGLVYLARDLPTIIIPDLHGRMNLLKNLLFSRQLGAWISRKTGTGKRGLTVLDKLKEKAIQVVCLGDGFHGEARAVRRWYLAYQEFLTGYAVHSRMDQEMIESLGVMEMVMTLKSAFPENFHFLKGNHENIKNETYRGNYGFYKFALEGEMVTTYVERFLGKNFIDEYYRFERNFPLLVVGRHFLASHAEPKRFFTREDVIDYRLGSEGGKVIEGLTWTANDAAEDGSVQQMIKHYLAPEYREFAYYFGGHRPVSGLHHKRAKGKYIQIHNPQKHVAAVINQMPPISLRRDIIDLNEIIDNKESSSAYLSI